MYRKDICHDLPLCIAGTVVGRVGIGMGVLHLFLQYRLWIYRFGTVRGYGHNLSWCHHLACLVALRGVVCLWCQIGAVSSLERATVGNIQEDTLPAGKYGEEATSGEACRMGAMWAR